MSSTHKVEHPEVLKDLISSTLHVGEAPTKLYFTKFYSYFIVYATKCNRWWCWITETEIFNKISSICRSSGSRFNVVKVRRQVAYGWQEANQWICKTLNRVELCSMIEDATMSNWLPYVSRPNPSGLVLLLMWLVSDCHRLRTMIRFYWIGTECETLQPSIISM